MRRTIGTFALGAAVAGAIAIPVGATAAGALPAQIGAAHRRLALQDAGDLVRGVSLPAGSERVTHELADVPFSFDAVVFADEVDRHALWTTAASPARVLRTVTTGTAPGQTRRLDVVSGPREASATFSLPSPGGSIVGRPMIGLDAVRRPGGTTAVRVDALVRYSAPRLPGQLVPATARFLEVTRSGSGRKPAVDLTVGGARVRRISRLIDALPLAAPAHGQVECPGYPLVATDTFVFRAAAGGPVIARVTATANTSTTGDFCQAIPLQIAGHGSVMLLEGGRLLHGASSILGVPLVAHPHGIAGQPIS
jgi:hypothetical protein